MHEASERRFVSSIQRLPFGGGNAVWLWDVKNASGERLRSGASTRSHADAETQAIASIESQKEAE